jgi:hypothetical protein
MSVYTSLDCDRHKIEMTRQADGSVDVTKESSPNMVTVNSALIETIEWTEKKR